MKKALLIALGVVAAMGVLVIVLIAWFISLNNRLVALQEKRAFRLGPGGNRAPAALRPDPQSGQHGERLCETREGRA